MVREAVLVVVAKRVVVERAEVDMEAMEAMGARRRRTRIRPEQAWPVFYAPPSPCASPTKTPCWSWKMIGDERNGSIPTIAAPASPSMPTSIQRS
ncbi:hypothetical protein CCP4SC76_3110003 [Gammaproteobacteria bacterium]